MMHSCYLRRSAVASSTLAAAGFLCCGCGGADTPPVADTRAKPVSVEYHKPITTSVVSAAAANAATEEPAAPRAEVAAKSFDFGAVEPLQTHRHTFEIRNRGTAPLKLSQQGSTCKCLELESISETVPPGGVGHVTVAWHAKAAQDVFIQHASVKTNDPNRPVIDFKLLGRALLLIAMDPPELIAARVKPDEPATVHATIFSQVLDEFTVRDLSSSLAGLEWKLSPAHPDRLASLGAKAGWNLQVTLPDNLPQGGFAHSLRFTAAPANPPQSIDADLLTQEIPVRGKVLRRLSVFGEGIDFDGTLDAGIVSANEGLEKTLIVRVQDRAQELNVTSVATQPDFVEARLLPFPQANKAGLYRLRLRIPPGATPGNYRGDNLGKVTLTFDHPRIDALELGLSFVVPNGRPSRLHQVGLTRSGP